ncbi:hypothetical protein D3C81_1993070 [compost metagenome]
MFFFRQGFGKWRQGGEIATHGRSGIVQGRGTFRRPAVAFQRGEGALNLPGGGVDLIQVLLIQRVLEVCSPQAH